MAGTPARDDRGLPAKDNYGRDMPSGFNIRLRDRRDVAVVGPAQPPHDLGRGQAC